MNPTETSSTLPTTRKAGDGNNKAKRFKRGKAGYRYTEASYARLRQGRPAKYPEAKILAERFGVTITHAIHVCAGRRVSHYLTAQLPAIRAELAARKEEV